MIRKTIIAASLGLPALMLSGVAHAGPTILDKNYFPSEARRGQHQPSLASQQFNSAHTKGPRSKTCAYERGPKSGIWTCR